MTYLDELIAEGNPPQCDCCDGVATIQMDKDSCEWCANWFVGWYCGECFEKVRFAMIKANFGLLP